MKLVPAALVGASLITVSLLAASPAVAAGNAIDPGDSLYAINCDSTYPDFQLFSVDPTTAFSTAIGSGEPATQACAAQPAYDPSTGTSYYIRWVLENDELASIDLATGVSTIIGGFFYDNGEFPEYLRAQAMAIGADGSAYLLAEDALWSLDLATGWVEPINETIRASAFAADPATGKFYAIDTDNEIFEIDVTTGAATSVGHVTFPTGGYSTYSLQFDEAGTFWIEVDYFEEEVAFDATLWSFTLATVDAPVYSGIFTDDPFYTEALLIVPGDAPPAPKPALADTGSDSSALPLAAGAGALLLAAGAVMLLRRRRSA